jgi:hypothetical protein
MSKATVELRDRPPADAGAQWWRMAFNTTEEVEMVADHPDEPTVITWTFPDGLDEDITPSSVRHRQPTTRLPEGGIAKWTGHGTTRRVDSLPEFFDVLMAGRPTNSPRWLELTEPGDLWHPDIPRPSSP